MQFESDEIQDNYHRLPTELQVEFNFFEMSLNTTGYFLHIMYVDLAELQVVFGINKKLIVKTSSMSDEL